MINKLKWSLVILLIVAAVVGNLYLTQFAEALRVAGVIVVCLGAGWLATTTPGGAVFVDFCKAARGEMRKVVWPTRQETVQTTVIVLAIVLIAALLMLAFDSLFHFLVSLVILK